jgi:hypothetical protein
VDALFVQVVRYVARQMGAGSAALIAAWTGQALYAVIAARSARLPLAAPSATRQDGPEDESYRRSVLSYGTLA